MTLTYPELIAIGGVLAAHKPVHQNLVKAIDRELREARKSLAMAPAPTHETESGCDKMDDIDGPRGSAGNTVDPLGPRHSTNFGGSE